MENTTQITVKDLETVRGIIDLAASRGAFKANEMAIVGEVYNKLSQFLEAVVAQATAQQAEAQGDTDSTTAESEAPAQSEGQ